MQSSYHLIYSLAWPPPVTAAPCSPSLAFALSQIVLYLQALACFATRADCSIRTYYLRVFPLSLEHMGARRPGQATAIPPRLVYGVSGPQTQPLSNSVERCCWTEPKLMQRISRPRHGTGLVCLQRSTPLPLHLGAYYDIIAVLGHPSFRCLVLPAHLLLQHSTKTLLTHAHSAQ